MDARDTLATFGEYLECQGQQQVDSLGYSALPVSLVKDGFSQLKRIPGSQVPTPTTAFIQQCNNPTYSANGTNALADHDPRPPACDKLGPTQYAVPAGSAVGAAGSAGRRSSKS